MWVRAWHPSGMRRYGPGGSSSYAGTTTCLRIKLTHRQEWSWKADQGLIIPAFFLNFQLCDLIYISLINLDWILSHLAQLLYDFKVQHLTFKIQPFYHWFTPILNKVYFTFLLQFVLSSQRKKVYDNVLL